MAVSLNSVITFNSSCVRELQANCHLAKRNNINTLCLKSPSVTPFREAVSLSQPREGNRSRLFLLATSGGNTVTETTNEDSKFIPETYSDEKSSNIISNTNSSTPDENGSKKVNSAVQVSEISNGSVESAAKPSPVVKRAPLTARERLRAARVLNRYTETKPSTPALGSKLLEALKETDKGKKRPSLPEAPTNLLDDSKRGLSKGGWDITLPAGMDVFFIAFSFVFISSVMFATTYLVWKVGAIHFNEF